jgi:type IV pilus assembly protein PilO
MAIDSIKNLTGTQRSLVFLLILLAMAGAFIWFVFIPYNDQISTLNGEISGLNNDINVHRTMVRHLDALKMENQKLEARLTVLKQKFPPEAEVALFLKQVSELGGKTGLNFKLWKPATRTAHSSGLYVEVPVNVEVSGEYHALGIFFDRISQLPRIINWANLKMANAKLVNNTVMIETSFSATAFASSLAGAAPAPSTEAAKKPAFEGRL